MREKGRLRSWRRRLDVGIACAFALLPVDVSAAIPTSERNALIALYDSTNGASWQASTNWLGPVGTECTWYGVRCDAGQTTVTKLYLTWNGLGGTIPADLGDLASLQEIELDLNELSGPIPASLGNLTSLKRLSANANALSGSIPAELGSLGSLQSLLLSANQLSGTIPSALGSLTSLKSLDLRSNQLSGSIPAQLGNLSALTELYLSDNQLSGTIPAALGSLTALTELTLFSNRLSGAIPPELGNLSSLTTLYLKGNQLSGEVPASLASLTKLFDGFGLDLRWNALHSSDAGLVAFLNAKQSGGDWQGTQTVAPTSVAVALFGPSSVTLSWTPIAYAAETGGYRVLVSTVSGGPYALAATATAKSATGATAGGLAPDTLYFFVVEAFTNPHANNPNTVVSEQSAEVSVTTLCPPVSIGRASVTEGDSGTATASFTVSISAACSQTATVDYATADDTGTAGTDYVAASGTLTFAPGVTTQPVTVTVNADTQDEPNEDFLVTLSNPVNTAITWARGVGTIVDDDGPGGAASGTPVELSHGTTLRRSLAALPGPVQEQHFFPLLQRPYTSYELVVDEISAALESLPGQPLAVDLLSADAQFVLKQSEAVSTLGASRSLRWMAADTWTEDPSKRWIRIRSGGCTTTCGPQDQYRVRFYETTYSIARFNNSGGQTTVLIVQNPTTATVNGTAYFWAASFVLSRTFAVAPGAALVLNTATLGGAAGQAGSGSITITNDAPYGTLVGKAVTVDPASGFSFDSPMLPRPR